MLDLHISVSLHDMLCNSTIMHAVLINNEEQEPTLDFYVGDQGGGFIQGKIHNTDIVYNIL